MSQRGGKPCIPHQLQIVFQEVFTVLWTIIWAWICFIGFYFHVTIPMCDLIKPLNSCASISQQNRKVFLGELGNANNVMGLKDFILKKVHTQNNQIVAFVKICIGIDLSLEVRVPEKQ